MEEACSYIAKQVMDTAFWGWNCLYQLTTMEIYEISNVCER